MGDGAKRSRPFGLPSPPAPDRAGAELARLAAPMPTRTSRNLVVKTNPRGRFPGTHHATSRRMHVISALPLGDQKAPPCVYEHAIPHRARHHPPARTGLAGNGAGGSDGPRTRRGSGRQGRSCLSAAFSDSLGLSDCASSATAPIRASTRAVGRSPTPGRLALTAPRPPRPSQEPRPQRTQHSHGRLKNPDHSPGHVPQAVSRTQVAAQPPNHGPSHTATAAPISEQTKNQRLTKQ